MDKKKPMQNWYDEPDDNMWFDEARPKAKVDTNASCSQVPANVKLAHAYVPIQCYEKAFSPAEALKKGTLFPELWGVYPIPK